ncbi:hypothetical protein CPB84DRAFT_1829160 [Gymnopilus junonius]|uniref:FAD/NAD(P)-binding domain-containing protein n=1 Tax=Gymnopilus junonius TaxID=109634 RepID=A0A9P5NBT7_GYMJU|nr:hypothetical protein CPB84DRAFT_1829160 [Gymnopilus junonius]
MAAQRIGIVGAGPAGLAALKAITDTPQYKAGLWIPTAFEARENVGGVWLPSPPPPSEPGNSPPATPLYDSLTTNLPHPVMAFTSLPFPASTPLFPKAGVVQTYLESYASSFGLHKHILLNTRVVSADWDPDQNKWAVETTNVNQRTKWAFDLLLVCNGHHNMPRYATIPGLDTWFASGRASHSMFYRNPSSIPLPSSNANPKLELKDLTILVIGGGPSGSDITTELVPLAGRVIHSFSANSAVARAAASSSASTPPPDVETLPDPVPSKEAAGAIPKPRAYFEDGSEEQNIHYCILATGYEVDFPFFASSPPTSTSKDASGPSPNFSIARSLIPYLPPLTTRLPQTDLINTSYGVFPLARHLFGIPSFGFSFSPSSEPNSSNDDAASSLRLPPPTSLAFLGLLVRVAPLPLVEVQARAALAAFANLPVPHRLPLEETKIINRFQELKEKYDALNDPDSSLVDTPDTSAPTSTPISTEKIREFISKEWHRFSEEARQFDYRDELDDLAFSLLSNSSSGPFEHLSQPNPSTLPRTRVRPWEKYFYAEKLPLRKAWRELEARGLADEWVRRVGSGELPADEEPRKTKEERVEAEWVALMERVLEFGKSL